MRLMELRTALENWTLILRHPKWMGAYLRGGRMELLRVLVQDSISEMRASPVPSTPNDLAQQEPLSILGRLGATQESLYFLVRMTRPDKIVETGVYRGISTAFMLAALEDNRRGRLWSVDLPNYRYTPGDGSPEDASPLFGRESTGFVVPAGLRPLWDLRLGDVRVVLPRLLTELTSIDLFYHDSAHTYDLMTWEYELAYAHLRPGGILTSDDVHWNSAFVDFTQKERFDWTHIFRKRLGVAILPA